MPRARHYKKTYTQENRVRKWLKILVQVGFFGFLLMTMAIFATFIYYARDLPRPEKFSEITIAQPTRIYDNTGNVLLFEVFGEERREVIPLEQVPQHFQQALIATEDAEFYTHFGLSIRGTSRALLINLGLRKSQTQRPGGSTITQQLARNSFLTTAKTIPRKIRELILTLQLERSYSKDEILGFYINQIPFGSNAYGISAASKLYFQKQPNELTVAESASLVALVQAPTYYSPHGPNKDGLLARKDYVLSRMEDEDFLTPEQVEEAQQEELIFQDFTTTIRAPHFTLSVVDDLIRTYGEDFIRENGLRVITSLDWELQQIAEKAVQEAAERNAKFRAHNASLVAIDPQTGKILALVGSKDWFADSFPEGCVPGKDCLFDPKVNIATYQQGRQPGSAFKPFVYAMAFKNGATASTTVIDEETNFGIWGGKEYIPTNYDGTFHGEVTLREALAQSLNIPSVKVLVDLAGIEQSVNLATDLGITTLQNPSFYGPALVLGGGEVRLLELTSAYGVFAAEGNKTPPFSILRIEDARGNVIERASQTSIRVLSPSIASDITDILSDNKARAPLFGFSSPLYISGYQVAAKTGTTQDYKDAWTIGYTSNIVVGVWAGNNDSTPTNRQPGAALASPLWNTFMTQALAYLASPSEDIVTP